MSSETSGSTGWYEIWAWAEENKKGLVIAAVVLVVLGSGFAVYRWNKDQTEVAASEALLEIRTSANASPDTPPPAASAFLKVVGAYPNTAAAERALLLAAGSLFTDGKYGEARAQFDGFLQRYGEQPLAATAALGKAASFEAEGKLDEALRAYQEVITRYPKASLLDDVRLALARLYEAKNQPQLALLAYDELTRTNLMSSKSAEAMTRREHLLAKHPELAKTNAPAISPPTAASIPVAPRAQVATNISPKAPAVSATNAVKATSANVPSAKSVTAAKTNTPGAKP